ncbi:DUF732 domain-containing protein [Mycobacterium sp. GA-1199]|uniref:DUF732 domain-containing protein n=1 Tax=Mycobacterium sp. GA-1199 TaxID=1772287 RepID=UPI000B09AA1F|nr:DUF732 domain-containing protein [Mycobacterium sp. GA-1199]
MNTIARFDAARRRPTRGPTRMLAILAAGLVLMLGLFGQALTTAPSASAITQDEALFISLLTEDGIGPRPGYSWNDLIFVGHAIAYDLRSGADLGAVTYELWSDAPYLDMEGAAKVVAASVVAFAPELVPIYTGDPPVYTDEPGGDMLA